VSERKGELSGFSSKGHQGVFELIRLLWRQIRPECSKQTDVIDQASSPPGSPNQALPLFCSMLDFPVSFQNPGMVFSVCSSLHNIVAESSD
jgi:hypothetical protein